MEKFEDFRDGLKQEINQSIEETDKKDFVDKAEALMKVIAESMGIQVEREDSKEGLSDSILTYMLNSMADLQHQVCQNIVSLIVTYKHICKTASKKEDDKIVDLLKDVVCANATFVELMNYLEAQIEATSSESELN